MSRPSSVMWVVNGNRQIASWMWYETPRPDDATPISARDFAILVPRKEGGIRYHGAMCEQGESIEVRTSADHDVALQTERREVAVDWQVDWNWASLEMRIVGPADTVAVLPWGSTIHAEGGWQALPTREVFRHSQLAITPTGALQGTNIVDRSGTFRFEVRVAGQEPRTVSAPWYPDESEPLQEELSRLEEELPGVAAGRAWTFAPAPAPCSGPRPILVFRPRAGKAELLHGIEVEQLDRAQYLAVWSEEQETVEQCAYSSGHQPTFTLDRTRWISTVVIRELWSGETVARQSFFGEPGTCDEQISFGLNRLQGFKPDADEIEQWIHDWRPGAP